MKATKTFNLSELQEKGQAGISGKMTALIGAVIVIFLVVALAPEMFSGLADLETDTNTPDWVPVVMFVIVGAGLVFLIWKTFDVN